MQFFFALFLAMKLIVYPKPLTAPTLNWKHGGFYDLINPLTKSIEAKIDCGEDYSKIIVLVPADTKQELELTTLDGTSIVSCHLDSYVTQRDVGE